MRYSCNGRGDLHCPNGLMDVLRRPYNCFRRGLHDSPDGLDLRLVRLGHNESILLHLGHCPNHLTLREWLWLVGDHRDGLRGCHNVDRRWGHNLNWLRGRRHHMYLLGRLLNNSSLVRDPQRSLNELRWVLLNRLALDWQGYWLLLNSDRLGLVIAS